MIQNKQVKLQVMHKLASANTLTVEYQKRLEVMKGNHYKKAYLKQTFTGASVMRVMLGGSGVLEEVAGSK